MKQDTYTNTPINKTEALELLRSYLPYTRDEEPLLWADQMEFNSLVVDQMFSETDIMTLEQFHRECTEMLFTVT